jgi:hypothetical protein
MQRVVTFIFFFSSEEGGDVFLMFEIMGFEFEVCFCNVFKERRDVKNG